MDLGLRQCPLDDGADHFGHVAPAPVVTAQDVAELDAMVLRADVDHAGQAAAFAQDNGPGERAASGPPGRALLDVAARLGGAPMGAKAHVARGLGIAGVGREDRVGVVHDGLAEQEAGGLERRRRLHGSRVTTTLPVAATAKPARGGMTRVEPSSSITAGPANRAPTESRARSYTIVSTKSFASGNHTGRRPLIGGSPPPARPWSATSLPATRARAAARPVMNSTGTSGGVSENFARYAASKADVSARRTAPASGPS